ncbi:MAG: ABC transporter ATP-binding protein [Dehalococcoidia bacterium]
MGMWGGGGSAAGWGGRGSMHDAGGRARGGGAGRSDGWDYEELGKIYDWRLIKRLVPYVTPYKGRVVLVLIAMLLTAIAQYAQPYIIGKGLESALRGASISTLNQIGILLVVLAGVAWVAQVVTQLLTAWVAQRLLYHLRNDVFAHMQKLSLSFYDKEEVGRVMSRLTSDVTVMQELLTTGMLNVLTDVAGLVIIIFFMFLMDAQLAVISLSVVPVLVIAMAFWQNYAQRAFIRVRQAIAQVNSEINQNVSGIRVVQSLRREDVNLRQFGRLNEENRQSNLYAMKLQAIVMPMVEVLSTIATVLIVVVIGFRLFNGSLDVATAVGFAMGFILFIQRFFAPIRDIVLQYTMLQRAMAGAHRVFEVLDTEPEIVDADDAIELDDVDGRVDFNHVDFSYIEGIPVLRDFDLHVAQGETVALVGHTGAGKTSVTALINRSYDIQGGSIEIDGIDLLKIKRKSLTRRMSVVLQEPYLFSGPIKENIRYGRLDATDDEIRLAAEAVGASEFVERLPDGYDTSLAEGGKNISIGQRQLIAFARAVVADPRIIILDEATAHVDTQTERVIQRALKSVLAGRTSFVIAHRLSTIRDADRIVMMRNGEILEVGTHDELMEMNDAYADFYRMTFTSHSDVADEVVFTGGGGAGGGSAGSPQP